MTIPNDKASLRKIFTLQGDKTLWAIFFILVAISLIEVYSAASTLTFSSGNIFKPILGHAVNLLVGFVCVWIFHNIPCGWFKFWLPAWVVFVALLIFLPLFGTKVNDGARWIDILGIRFQPSEFAKGSLIVIVAFFLSAYQTKKGADRHAFKYILLFTGITCFFIFLENFSTAAILFLVVVLMMYFGRVPLKQLGTLMLWLIGLGIGVILLAKVLSADAIVEKVPMLHRLTNFTARIDRFLGKDDQAASDSTRQLSAKDFDIQKEPQVGHAHIAIAKSNIFGCGPGNSRERDFLPQAYSDFIFAIIPNSQPVRAQLPRLPHPRPRHAHSRAGRRQYERSRRPGAGNRTASAPHLARRQLHHGHIHLLRHDDIHQPLRPQASGRGIH